MGNQKVIRFKGVVLVSPPWPLYNRPSIQLGSLKAYLKTQIPTLRLSAHHMYLEVAQHIGYPVYQCLSERMWLAETVYAALLFPNQIARIEKLFARKSKGNKRLKALDFEHLVSKVRTVSEAFVQRIRWDDFSLAGFSICLCQMTAAIYLIRKIKMRFPGLKTVVGGSTFSGLVSKQLFEAFPEIDYWVNGEGEQPLTQLTRRLIKTPGHPWLTRIPGVIQRGQAPDNAVYRFSQLAHLDPLPQPDYDDYFDNLKSLAPEKQFFPALPVELSRGCRWHRDCEKGAAGGCAFCNLNLQWGGYRSKCPGRAVSEIDTLTSRYKVLDVALTDNLIPVDRAGEIFDGLSKKNKDFKLFCEIRPNTSRRLLRRMKNAGVKEVQIGIESLCTTLLEKLNKGVTAIQNLQIMKQCEALGIISVSNLILCFPGSDAEEVAETIRVLDFATIYRPLRAVNFWLGFGSLIAEKPSAYGIKAIFNHPYYKHLFPGRIVREVRFMVQSYRGDSGLQKLRWQPVRKRLREWEKAYQSLKAKSGDQPILSYRDGGNFMIIRQQRLKKAAITHRLTGDSRAIYLFCSRHRSMKAVLKRFNHLPESKIASFLEMMVDKRLMFREKNRFLSLAIRIKQAA